MSATDFLLTFCGGTLLGAIVVELIHVLLDRKRVRYEREVRRALDEMREKDAFKMAMSARAMLDEVR